MFTNKISIEVTNEGNHDKSKLTQGNGLTSFLQNILSICHRVCYIKVLEKIASE